MDRRPPVKGAYVINIGNVMMRWTNGRFVSTPHRVVNRALKPRYSIPFFANSDFDADDRADRRDHEAGRDGGVRAAGQRPLRSTSTTRAWPISARRPAERSGRRWTSASADAVALITGPAKGMGAAISLAFAAEGCRLALLARDLDAVARSSGRSTTAAGRRSSSAAT